MQWILFLAALRILSFVRLSACHTFLTMFLSSYHHEIFRSYYRWQKWCPYKRSRSKAKVTEGTRHCGPIWTFPDHNSSLNLHMATKWGIEVAYKGALLFFEIIHQISRSHGKNGDLTELGFSGLSLEFEFTDDCEMMHKAWSSIEEVSYCFQGYPSNFKVTREKIIADFDPNWAFPNCNSRLNRMTWQWAETLVEIRLTLVDIRGTTK